MWTLASKTTKRFTVAELQERERQTGERQPAGRLLQLLLTMTFTTGPKNITVETWISTKSDVRGAIKQNLDRLNEQEELEAEIAADTFTIEEPVPTEPTAEELKQKEIAKAEQALEAELARAERTQKAKEMAATDADVKAKLDALQALQN